MTRLNKQTGELLDEDISNYDVHPAATLFPLIEGEAFEAFVEDVRANGQQTPVVLDSDGRLLDGRNRVRACQRLGIDVLEVVHQGDDPYAFVVSNNLHRRHLSESQRAMVAAKLANLRQGSNRYKLDLSIDRSRRETKSGVLISDAAQALNVSTASVSRARIVRDHGTPELTSAVEAGTLTVSKAANIIQLADRQPDKVAQLHADHEAGKPLRPPTPSSAPKPSAKRKRHLAILESLTTSLAGQCIALQEITVLDQTVTKEEAARLRGDLSEQIKSLNKIKLLLEERTK